MKVTVRLTEPKESIEHTGVDSTFMDGAMYCIKEGDKLYKYKFDKIWLLIEDSTKEEEAV